MELFITKRERLSRDQFDLLRTSGYSKVSRVPGKGGVQGILEHGNRVSIPKKEENHNAGSLELRTKLLDKTRKNTHASEPPWNQRTPKKCCTATNKKRQLGDDRFDDEFEEDEEIRFLLKARARKRARNLESVMSDLNSEDPTDNAFISSKDRCSGKNAKAIHLFLLFPS